METKRKKTLFNVIMVVLILIIAGCGIMAVGNLKGWFGKDENSVLVSQNVKGVANIQRSGVGYGLEKNVSLRDGDILETKNGTTADLSAGEENILSLNANTELEAVSVKKAMYRLVLIRENFLQTWHRAMKRFFLHLEKTVSQRAAECSPSASRQEVLPWMYLRMRSIFLRQTDLLIR